MIKTTSIAAAAAALVFTGLSFSVAAPANAKDVTVTYADLDLTSAEGQKKLDHRLDAAAREVCGYNDVNTGSRLRNSDAVACYDKARAQFSAHVAAAVDSANARSRVATN
ncbi:UrcA family protein [Novosphingobium sp. BL-8H]|uniref:UrcA family protein n=1 Tax=Novosphingobium sp. BL-8H TaxID=3127640 RepID=UPI0037570D0C